MSLSITNNTTRKLVFAIALTSVTSMTLSWAFRAWFGKTPSSYKPKDIAPVEMRRTIEICLSDIESVRHAIRGGATSVEICSDRPEGGTTPSIGLVEEAVKLCSKHNVEVHVLIRPRAGDFVYSKEEFEVMKRDILAVKQAGADGVVVGIHSTCGQIDKRRMAIIRELSFGMQLTFHRAFDLISGYEQAIEDIIALGCDRLLTSGQEKYAHLAATTKLRRIVELCGNKIHVIAGAGISADNVRPLIVNSRVHGVHIGSAVNRNVLSDIVMNSTLETPLFTMAAEMKVWKCTHADLIKEVVDRAKAAWRELDMY